MFRDGFQRTDDITTWMIILKGCADEALNAESENAAVRIIEDFVNIRRSTIETQFIETVRAKDLQAPDKY